VEGPARADIEILVVDEEPSGVRLLGHALQSACYKPPQGLPDSLQAASYLDSTDPDPITPKSCLPGLDGYDLPEALVRRLPPCPWHERSGRCRSRLREGVGS